MIEKKSPQLAITVLGLSLADLKHEWILTLCLIGAMAAIIAPLLLLMGLKHGTISTLREQLVQDPKYQEIRPTQALSYKLDWFKQLAKREEVAFLIPRILPTSSIIRVVNPESNKEAKLIELLATGENDPLILKNGGKIPNFNQAVLSHTVAEKLKMTVGDRIEIQVLRHRKGRKEKATTPLEIVAILSPRAGNLDRIYVTLDIATAVENYREGHAVPKFGWSGGTAEPYLSFDGIIILLPEALDELLKNEVVIDTGLTHIQTLKAQQFELLTGFSLEANYVAYHLTAANDIVKIDSLNAIKNKLRGQNAIILPYVKPFEVQLESEPIKVFGLSLSSQQTEKLGINPLPWQSFRIKKGKHKTSKRLTELRKILLPQANPLLSQEKLTMNVSGKTKLLSFPVQNVGSRFGHYALIPLELAATLRTGRQREIFYDSEQQTFALSRLEYRGFRLYAKSIDDVPLLYKALREDGIEVTAQLASIEKVKVLDRGLTRIFWLIALVGILGGVFALVMSLYAAVERKKKEIGIMRLIGLSRLNVASFPIYQSVTIAWLGIILAFAAYISLASIINYVFSNDLAMGQQICQLSNNHLIYATLITIMVAFLSSLLAAWKATQIEPAEALREE